MYMTVTFLAILTASLAGSLHCAGMCSGFVAFVSGQGKRVYFQQALYHLGRASSYIFLGFLAGYLGESLDAAFNFSGIQRIMLLVTGVLLVFWGVRGLAGKGGNAYELNQDSPLYKIVRFLFKKTLHAENGTQAGRAFTVGVLSALLPCGWLYSFVLVAAAGGSGLNGALIMAGFWAGTIPSLALTGSLIGIAGKRLQALTPRLVSLLFIVAGLGAIAVHAGMISKAHHHSVISDNTSDRIHKH
ncbi:MAG: sulfite exporter TauE/SafE family protein [Candidatus Dadabacteria bacterium]|nr:MAG: sulfite exporter TauE/SafE family protein [Candidatus Dadabacteria bacterium]